MKMMLVIPETRGLSWGQEIRTITSNFQAQVVTGSDVSPSIVAASAAGQRFDILHVAAHGGPEGVALPEGILEIDSLLRLAKNTEVELVFLNACSTTVPMQYLYSHGVPNVISHAVDQVDAKALELAIYFYGTLRSLRGISNAFEKVDPGTGELVMLPGVRCRQNVLDGVQRQMFFAGSLLGLDFGQIA